jgi:hypothetical protein
MRVMWFALWVAPMAGFGCAEKDNDQDFGEWENAGEDTGPVFGADDTDAGDADADAGADSSAYQRVFDEVIAPKCRACHSGDRPAGGLHLETQDESYTALLGGYVTPGDPDSSLLVERITLDIDDDSLMPPNAKLDDDMISIVVDWVLAGALE